MSAEEIAAIASRSSKLLLTEEPMEAKGAEEAKKI